jgi:hypothetical protein
VVLTGSKPWDSSYLINGLRWSDLVKKRINTTNIDKPSRSDDSGLLSNDGGLLSNDRELRI